MILLDENFPDDQRDILNRWRLPHRQVGREVAWLGAQDSDLIPLLHQLHGVTFFTLDEDFFKLRLCHGAYCLVWLDVSSDDAAEYLRILWRVAGPDAFPVATKYKTGGKTGVAPGGYQ